LRLCQNRAAANQYMREHYLEDYSFENLTHAIETLSDHLGLELSKAAIEEMASHLYKKHVEQGFKEWQAKQPEPKPSEGPFGVRSWSEWVHNK
jgi:hypothetical protein